MGAMLRAQGKSGLRLAGARELLLPLTVTVCFVLYYLVQAPFWSVVGVAIPLVALYSAAPSWAASSVARFDRDLVQLLSTGRRAALPGRYARAFGMRLFAPPAIRAERRAVVAAENGEPRAARTAYRAALHEYGNKGAPLRVLLGYAHASYALGEDAEAVRVYRLLVAQSGMLPGVRRNLAHALVRRGEALREALELIEGEAGADEGTQRRHELDLLRAVAHAKLGDSARARELLAQAEAAEGEVALSLREELHRTLERGTEARSF